MSADTDGLGVCDAFAIACPHRFANNDMAAILAGAYCEGGTVELRNNVIMHKVWFNRRRPGKLTEIHAEAGGVSHNESQWEKAWRAARAKDGGLDLDHGVDIDDPLHQVRGVLVCALTSGYAMGLRTVEDLHAARSGQGPSVDACGLKRACRYYWLGP